LLEDIGGVDLEQYLSLLPSHKLSEEDFLPIAVQMARLFSSPPLIFSLSTRF
jgi:hypothetical protein